MSKRCKISRRNEPPTHFAVSESRTNNPLGINFSVRKKVIGEEWSKFAELSVSSERCIFLPKRGAWEGKFFVVLKRTHLLSL